MNTKILKLENYINTGELGDADIAMLSEAAGIMRRGGLCAFPTETVYGLGGNGLLPEASKKIYAAKGRPSDNPLILHISCLEELEPITAVIPDTALKLAQAFWPGPMTLVLEKSALVPFETTGGLDTVAVRMPSHPAARELIRMTGLPVAAPSANRSGRPSTTSAQHCIEDLWGSVDAIVDGGPCEIGLESSIFDLTGERPALLRPGAITREMAEAALGVTLELDAALCGPLSYGTRPRAPGMKYRHYAPKAPMTLVTGKAAAFRMAELAGELTGSGKKVYIICSRECAEELGTLTQDTGCGIRILGSRNDMSRVAEGLFSAIRDMDGLPVDHIIAEGFLEEGLGQAVMNRLYKASGWQVLRT